MSMSLTEVRLMASKGRLLMVGLGVEGEILLKARLPMYPSHPRAAVSVLEGLALWSGRRLPVVVGVTASSGPCIEALLPDSLSWVSPLVDLHLVHHPPRRVRKTRLDGLGDFREALQLRLPVCP